MFLWLCLLTAVGSVDIEFINGSFDDAFSIYRPEYPVYVVVAVDSRNIDIVPHFVRHYSAFGVPLSNFLVILNGRALDDVRFTTARATLRALYVNVAEWIGDFSSLAALKVKLRLLYRFSRPNWLLYADIDEFVALSGNVRQIVAEYERRNYTHSFGTFRDRVARDGSLPEIKGARNIADQLPLRCNITIGLLRAMAHKMCFVRGDLRASTGNHFLMDDVLYRRYNITRPRVAVPLSATKMAPDRWTIDHYKWSAGIVDSLRERVSYYRTTGRFHWWRESQRFLDQYDALGRIDVRAYCKNETMKALV